MKASLLSAVKLNAKMHRKWDLNTGLQPKILLIQKSVNLLVYDAQSLH